jgi:hypothetical protein
MGKLTTHLITNPDRRTRMERKHRRFGADTSRLCIVIVTVIGLSDLSAGSAGAHSSAAADVTPLPNLASEMVRQIDSATIVISPKYFRAMTAVAEYRRRNQRVVLTPSERDLMNFFFQVFGPERNSAEEWLTSQQKRDCLVIALVARPAPGEPIMLDAHARAGRTVLYAVRKSDYVVVRARIVED